MTTLDFALADYISRSIIIVPIIVGIVQSIKLTKIPDKYSPVIAIAVGVLISFMLDSSAVWGHSVLGGIIYGLSASGLYSGTRTLLSGSGTGGGGETTTTAPTVTAAPIVTASTTTAPIVITPTDTEIEVKAPSVVTTTAPKQEP